jgi:Protein of unknown function (DUF3014)
MKKYAPALLAVFYTTLIFALIALGAGGYYWWQRGKLPADIRIPAATAPNTPDSPAPLDPAPPEVAQAPAPAASEGAIQHPIDLDAASSQSLPAPGKADAFVGAALTELLGRKNVLTFLQLDGFARRVVATTDNLAREHAAPALWPTAPMPGRFTTLAVGSLAPTAISPNNSQRYTPFVQFIESVDTTQAVKLYTRLYPLFQQAYEELGFPRRYFNDRLVAVIDLLLATPVTASPPEVSLIEVKGPVASLRPWVRYEFTDPALRKLTAGQKMLLRTGPDNQRRLKAKLQDIRRLISTGAPVPGSGRP